MENFVIVKDEDNNDIKIEVILSFGVEKLNKNYIAYTLNDDENAPAAAVFISEIDPITNKIMSIPPEQRDVVISAYQIAKREILKDEQ